VHLGKVNNWYRTADSNVSMHVLRVRHAQSQRDAPVGAFGLFGAQAYSRTPGSYGEVTFSKASQNTQFEIHYLEHPQGGDFRLFVDGREMQRIKTRAEEEAPGFYSFETEPGERVIRARLTGRGTTRLLGMTAETKGPGVVVDTLGISGARMASQLKWNEGYWAEVVKRRNPDLVTFAYGSNETMETHKKIETYEAEVREVVARLRRAAPEASCLFIAPFDFPRQQKRRFPTRERLIQVLEVQRRVAREVNCGFWDGYAFMGGNGSMHRWAHAHPPMARSDHLHLTPLGYVAAGIAIGDALMRKYDAFAERQAERQTE
jgi:lysophospholipase L1-like esterase